MTRGPLAWLLAACIAVVALRAGAHDLITAESAAQYIEGVQRELQVLRSNTAPPPLRARSNVAVGKALDEIKDLLNRDIASHGQPQGLATLYLMQALREHGLGLEISGRLRRYPANLAFYRNALQLDPDGLAAGEARLRLLQGHFYDSFDQDPLHPRDQAWPVLKDQIGHAQALMRRPPAEPEREEVHFILAVHHMQAAVSVPDAALRRAHAAKAKETVGQFKLRYPDSLRVAALEVLVEDLGQRGGQAK